jgi:adenine-specific DNA-methyltransferase
MAMDANSLAYDRNRHAAARTADYVFHQLIPYIGNKRKRLGLIKHAIRRTGCARGRFVDFFAGSGVVARMAKRLGYRVAANDWEPCAEIINRCYVGCNTAPAFTALGRFEA